MATPLTWIEAPARAPRPNRSLDVLPVHDVSNVHFVGYNYMADPCAFPNPLPKDCYVQIGPTVTPVSEVQRATITGTPTGGTFTLTYASKTTTAIPYNATAATVQTALEALESVAPGDVVVTGGPGPGTPYTFTFGGNLANADLPQMTAAGSFTGGTTPAIAITTITAGVALKTFGSPGNEVITQVFGAYQGIRCSLNGGLDEFRSIAQRVLENGEHFVVDGALTALLQTAAVATTPATATTAQGALGALEQALAQQVPGQGYIFLSPIAATYAVGQHLLLQQIDGSLTTILGTPVVILTDPAALNVAYASGPVNIWRGPVEVNDTPDFRLNMGSALAERLYSVSIECKVFKITWTPAAADPTSEEPEPEVLELTLGSTPSSPIPDGTDVTITVFSNVAPDEEVFLHYSINGGPDVTAGEMTEVAPTEFVWNVDGSLTVAGDTVNVWAVSGTTESNHIVIEVI